MDSRTPLSSRLYAGLVLVTLLLGACGSGDGSGTNPVDDQGQDPPGPGVQVNGPPVSSNDSFSVAQGATFAGHLPQATDPDGDAVTYGIAVNPLHGVASIQSNGAFSYISDPEYSGSDQFWFRVQDEHAATALYRVFVTVLLNPPSCPPLTGPPPVPSPPPPDGRRIALVSERDGNSEIYTVNSDGTGLLRLTNNPAEDSEPAWSPDGSRIAFVSERSGARALYVMNADGSNVVQIATSPAYISNPAWSPVGDRIAFDALSNGSSNIWVVDLGGSAPQLLFEAPGWDAQAAWSSDGSQLALVSDWYAYDFVYDIFVIKSDGTGFRTLTGSTFDNVDYFHPAWSPDGTRITMTISRVLGIGSYEGHVGVMDADGKSQVELICANANSRNTWSADGTRIAFQVEGNIAWVAADGSASGIIVTNGREPSWQH